jgi:alpha-L-arabinofuranosidase
MGGNVFAGHARPSESEPNPVVLPGLDPGIIIMKEDMDLLLHMSIARSSKTENNVIVTTDLLGKTAISGLPFMNYDGKPLKIDTDYFGIIRDPQNPFPGPFENPLDGKNSFKISSITPRSNN